MTTKNDLISALQQLPGNPEITDSCGGALIGIRTEGELPDGRAVLEFMTEPRTWKYGLTAEEWLHLAAEGPDSEVAPCCGDIGQLRDVLNMLATDQAQGGGIPWLAKLLCDAYEAARNSHDTLADSARFPLLHRVFAGIRDEAAEHEAMMAEHREFAARMQAERQEAPDG